MFALNGFMMKGAKQMGAIEWGKISVRSQYALIMLATAFTWMMGLMGYIRSSVRLFWHVNEIMRDNSPWAYTHTVGFRSEHDFIQCAVLLGHHPVRLLAGSLGVKKAPVEAKAGVPGGAPQPAGGH